MTNEELVIQIKQGNAKAVEQLWSQLERLAGSMARKWEGFAEYEDLMQEAFLALYEAVEGYEQQESTTFSGYFAKRVKWRWCRYVARSGHIPQHMFWKVLQYKRFVSQHVKEYGSAPSQPMIAAGLKLTLREVGQIRDAAKQMQTRSIFEPVGENDEDLLLGDSLIDSKDCFARVLDKVQDEQLKKDIEAIISALPEKESEVVKLRYQDGLTLKEISEWTGETVNVVRGRWQSALSRMRRGPASRKIRKMLKDDERYSYGLKSGIGLFMHSGYSSTEYAAFKAEGWIYDDSKAIHDIDKTKT